MLHIFKTYMHGSVVPGDREPDHDPLNFTRRSCVYCENVLGAFAVQVSLWDMILEKYAFVVYMKDFSSDESVTGIPEVPRPTK